MADQGFYNTGNMDLKYMEIGIALARIDRMRPGKVPFCIPVLTPTLPQNDKQESTIVMNGKTNIVNKNKGAVETSNIDVSNYIEIEIPRELTCLPDPIYRVEGDIEHEEMYEYRFDGNGSARMSGLVVEGAGGSINVSGTLTGDGVDMYLNGHIKGIIQTELHELIRYIEKGSKWLIAFVGGDTSHPVVVCRLPDDVGYVDEKLW